MHEVKMEKEVARAILATAIECSRAADESAARIKEACEVAVSKRYARIVGGIMGNILTEILAPMWNEHADLASDWYKMNPGGVRSTPSSPGHIDRDLKSELIALMAELERRMAATMDLATRACSREEMCRYRAGVYEVLHHIASAEAYIHSMRVIDEERQ